MDEDDRPRMSYNYDELVELEADVPDGPPKEESSAGAHPQEGSMMTLSVGMLTCKGDDGEEYSIPLNINRPRSNSGSRYLTDKVV